MTKQERLVTWGLLAFIAYEIYRGQNPAPAQATFQVNSTSPVPNWVQQYSYAASQEIANTDVTGDTIYNNLLSIPQGPGGSPDGVTPNYFNPAAGIMSFCPTPQPQSQTFAMPQPLPGSIIDIQAG